MAEIVSSDANFFLTNLLREVSRSFYLTLRMLPKPIRSQIGFAYLLARATDTIADTEGTPVEERLSALRRLRDSILNPGAVRIDLGELSAGQATQGEKLLLTRADEIIQLIFRFPPSDLALIQQVLQVITSGQLLDLERFGYATATSPAALQTSADLDDYTYRVAGCVGEFWTNMCVAHLHPKPSATLDDLLQRGIRFGKGLQLVNVLRDIPADLQKGRCYLPLDQLRSHNLAVADLHSTANEQRFRPLYNAWLSTAREHLRAGWSYTADLPWRWTRVRLACAWPILIGLRTTDLLQIGSVLDPAQRIKISRSEVRSILFRTSLLYPIPVLWRRLSR